jgi:tripartite-type tricarboxylate transporter receptor subunit TctC
MTVVSMTVVSRQSVRLAGPLVALASLLFLVALMVAAPALAADTAVLRGKHIVFVEPYGPDSATNVPLALMRDEIARKTGATVDVVPVGGRAGGSVLDYVLSPPPAIAEDAVVFAVLDIVSRSLAESAGDRTRLLQAMQPVATVSGALSSALIVADNSAVRTIDDLLARARTRPLKIVGLGRKAAFGIELAMLEKATGLTLDEKIVSTRAEILAALASGEADAGFLVTVTLLPSTKDAPPPVRPILTFAGKRNPGLPDIPTFREAVAKDKKGTAIAGMVAVFAPLRTPKPVVAAMASVLRDIAAEPEIKAAAAARNYPLAVAPAAAVSDEMARVARMIKQHKAYLDR